ncbi:hypothetical protein [Salimicrobium album]|uniref:Uncharacterized protein n=1 Tax=Salimicrobium album TaxID=50717 RepID=A0A1H3G5H6_9BACI|nr:hypothetical protein [Salimicrobium album]SDX97609.1 hypothetical protein SAMN04488081_1780 [Salimicrobium album]
MMILILNETIDSKDHWFEVELWQGNGVSAFLKIIASKESESLQETNNYINDLDRRGIIKYYDLTLDYNNRKFTNVMNLEELLTLIRSN